MNKHEIVQAKLRIPEYSIKLSESKTTGEQGKLISMFYKTDYKKTKEIYNELKTLILE